MPEIKIKIDCNGEYCGKCDHVYCNYAYCNKDTYLCEIFNKILSKRRIKKGKFDYKRCRDCIKAEGKINKKNKIMPIENVYVWG